MAALQRATAFSLAPVLSKLAGKVPMPGSSFNLAEAGFEGAFSDNVFAQEVKSNPLAFFRDQSM